MALSHINTTAMHASKNILTTYSSLPPMNLSYHIKIRTQSKNKTITLAME